ncbi:MAG: hypothetical protein K1X88_33860 [Nannocystaceae bacterium]|nr:hypothetical protein [Nannocystaceae bacterium]
MNAAAPHATGPALDRLLAQARRRQRTADAAWALSRVALPVAVALLALGLVATRRLGLPQWSLWFASAPIPAVLAWAWLRPLQQRKLVRRIDEFHRTADRLGSAYEFARGRTPADPRTAAIVALVQHDAEQLAATLDARPAIPVRVPGPRALDSLPLALLGLALLVPIATAELASPLVGEILIEPVAQAKAKAGLDLALASPLRQSLRELSHADDEAAAAAKQMLEILDALERGEIDRALALEQLEELERQIAEAEEKFDAELREDPALLAEATQDLAAALQTEELTEDVGKALDRGDGDNAEQALAEAGDKADAQAESDEQMKRSLSEAERRLGQRNDEREASETAKQLDEAERRLRREEQKKPQDPEEAAEHERRLKQQRDKVEQLKRQHERELAAQKKVEELRRQAKEAAQSKAGSADRKRKLEQLGRGMKEASRTARGAQRMQGARDALEEAKTFVRRAGESGSGQDRRKQQFRRFDQAAKGQQQGQQGKDGKDGKGKGQGKSTLLVEGDVGQGEPNAMMEQDSAGQGQGQDGQGQDGQGQDGQGQGDGQGQDGQGQGDGQGQDGQGDGQGQDGQGQGQGQDGQGDGRTPGDGIGTGSQDPLADPTAMRSGTKDVRVDARRGRGVSKAEILKDASQHGFASEPYRKMFKEYRDFAQSTLDSDAFPAAQRRLVKRYYQMIQAR